jgi:hypothetical protein
VVHSCGVGLAGALGSPGGSCRSWGRKLFMEAQVSSSVLSTNEIPAFIRFRTVGVGYFSALC